MPCLFCRALILLAVVVPFASPALADETTKHVVFIYNENNYKPQETLPPFAKQLAKDQNVKTTLLRVEPGQGIVGIEALASADLVVLFIRREALPLTHLSALRNHLDASKPLIALRTSSHAFALKGPLPKGMAHWDTFDADVLGGNYHGHYPDALGVDVQGVDVTKTHPILAGVDLGNWHAAGELYQVLPLAKDATVLLNGAVAGQPAEPIAWTRKYKHSRIFYTSLGHPEHFNDPRFRKLLTNAVTWSLTTEPDQKMVPYVKAKLRDSGEALSPADSLAKMHTPDDLELEQVLTEPEVAQPVFMTFDERGRMWVVQYLQYPFPAGLKILSEDKFLRATYDKVPPPPPHHFRGLDKITIHEDTDGDGKYDRHKTFVEGLNIVSACAIGRGGVWVLNPPYLLFYPDKNGDDVPDGDPEVHLQGFGLEDTHSVVNSLQWGPDGWLYAAQGSTVSGDVVRPGRDKSGVHSLGQLIWRYHPERRKYEIFAEGGGNAFGVEIDAVGRIFSGHNGGDTRGFHYVQGGYYQKGFAKHGALSNPFTFGYFPAMQHAKTARFTHCTIIYEGGALPAAYRGKLFGVHPLLSHVVYSQLDRDGSSFKTVDLGQAISSDDSWFRPVDIKVGPDGAIYVADMYEGQIAHLLHHEGKIDRSNGRIYRLKAKGAKPLAPFDLGKASTAELVGYLSHPNKWFRREALRVLGDRKDTSAPKLVETLMRDEGQVALESVWALNATGSMLAGDFTHANPFVRIWTIRLAVDNEQGISDGLARSFESLAATETNVEVRSQLACSARRLPAHQGLPIVARLLTHSEDVDDIHLPLLLWWAIESKADSDRDAVLALFKDPEFWKLPLVEKHLLSRTMRRYAAAGSRKDLLTCAALLQLSPGEAQSKLLIQGFEEAFQGRRVANLPAELVEAMARFGGGSLTLGVRQGKTEAVDQALAALVDDKTDANQRIQLVQVFGEVKQPRAVAPLLQIVSNGKDDGLRMAALTALQPYDDPAISRTVLGAYGEMTDDVRSVAQTLLASRKSGARALVAAVDAGQIDAKAVPLDVVRKLTVHRDEALAAAIKKLWGSVDGATTAEMQSRIAQLRDILDSGPGTPYAGKKLFLTTCAKCHKLFTDGGQIGPDLTSYKRDDLNNILLNVVNPSAEIREGFETYQALTSDGRVVEGFLVERDNQVVVLRGADGQNISLEQSEIEELNKIRKSIMPEGQLNTMTEQQIRDLFAYLRSTQPLAD